MARARYKRRSSLSMARQAAMLTGMLRDGRTRRLSHNELLWEGALTPGPIGRTYTVQVRLRRGHNPSVRVLSPDLKAIAGELPLKHVYDAEEQRLCLFLPGSGEWDSSMPLATTVLPWAEMWLHSFEDYVATGVWHGGGVHPDGSVDEEARSEQGHV